MSPELQQDGPLARRSRALARLAQAHAVLAPLREGAGFGVFSRGDRRRRPAARLRREDVRALVFDGAIVPSGIADCYLLSPAGRARVQREAATEAPFLEQHIGLVPRAVIDKDGAIRTVRGVDAGGPVGRLLRLTADGACFFTGREIAAARTIWAHFEEGARGQMGASDWTAPPRGDSARGPSSTQESRLLSGMSARDAVREALAALPASLAAAVKAFCLEETGLETLERQRRWPARSGKVVLKLALEQLADFYKLA